MHIFEKKSLKYTSLNIVYDAGALYENEGRYGTMHLMEHLICKNFIDMYDELQENGIEWNAYTCDESVIVYFEGLNSRLTPALKAKLVKKLVGGLKVKKDVFETEKNVVLQEYADAFNAPEAEVLNVFRTRYNYFTAIGKKSDIEAFTLDDAKEVYNEYFKNPTRIVEIGPEKSNFSFVTFNENVREYRKIKYKKVKNELEKVPESDKADVILISKKSISKGDYPYMKIALHMLSGGLNSPFCQEIREKRGLSYFSSASVENFRDVTMFNFSACTTKDKKDELVELYKNLIDNVETHLTKERFDIVYNSILVAKEEQKIFRYAHCDDLIRKGLPMIPKNIKKLTYEKLLTVAQKYINLKNLEIVVME